MRHEVGIQSLISVSVGVVWKGIDEKPESPLIKKKGVPAGTP